MFYFIRTPRTCPSPRSPGKPIVGEHGVSLLYVEITHKYANDVHHRLIRGVNISEIFSVLMAAYRGEQYAYTSDGLRDYKTYTKRNHISSVDPVRYICRGPNLTIKLVY